MTHPAVEGENREIIADIAQRAATRLDQLAHGSRDLLDESSRLLRRLDEHMPGRAYNDLPAELRAAARAQPELLARICALALAELPARAPRAKVPQAVLRQLQIESPRLLSYDTGAPDDDVLLKDLAIATLHAFPCVAQVVERFGGIPRSLIFAGGVPQFSRLAPFLLRTGSRNDYFQIHTHTPMLGGFNREGWLHCYRLLAELLRAHPDCPGMVGASWFYDPAMADVSPRLTYLVDDPLAGGAFRIRVGSSQKDVDLATATSASRRELHQRGEYTPTSWMLIWPRKELLQWASTQRAGTT